MSGYRFWRGPFNSEPVVDTKHAVGSALVPGVIVALSAGVWAAAGAATRGSLHLLSNRDFFGQDTTTAYASGDTGAAIRLLPGDEVQAQMDAATYTERQELTLSANGRLKAAASTDLVVAFYDDTTLTKTAGQLADVIWSSYYIK